MDATTAIDPQPEMSPYQVRSAREPTTIMRHAESMSRVYSIEAYDGFRLAFNVCDMPQFNLPQHTPS